MWSSLSLPAWYSFSMALAKLSRFCRFSGVRKWGTHLDFLFLISRWSCKMSCIVRRFSDVRAWIARRDIRRSSSTSCSTRWILDFVAAVTGLPGWAGIIFNGFSALAKLLWPGCNYAIWIGRVWLYKKQLLMNCLGTYIKSSAHLNVNSLLNFCRNLHT